MRRRAPLIALLATALIAPAAALAAPAPALATPAASAATTATAAASGADTSVAVYASGGGVVADGADLVVSVVVTSAAAASVSAGTVTVAVTQHPIADRAALDAFEKQPRQTPVRKLGTAKTTALPPGLTAPVATVRVPAASVHLPQNRPGVYGLTATVSTPTGSLGVAAGTVVVPGSMPASIGVAAVMPITVPARADGLITAQDLTSYTAADGLLSRELKIAESNPQLTLGIDPMILASIRVLGQSAPASAQDWIQALADLPNDTFPLQYGNADPGLQTQAGLAAPLGPIDFDYAMNPADHGAPLTVGEPPTPTADPTPTPTATPTPGTQLPSLNALVDWPYSLGGIAWPAPGSVRAADLATFARAGMSTTIVSGANTDAGTLHGTADAVLPAGSGTALVTDDGISQALQTAATATNAAESGVASAALTAQLALAAENAQNGSVVLVSLGQARPTDAARAASAVTTALDSAFSRPSTLRSALTAPPTSGLRLVDASNPDERVALVGDLLDREGDPRTGGTVDEENIAAFSSVLEEPKLLTGEVRAQLLSLFSVDWSGSADWPSAAVKELTSLGDSLSAVQMVSPGPIRQLSHQALIPITVTNKLRHPVSVVLRATPSTARLEIESDTTKTIAAGSSAKVLVPVKAQLGNGAVYLSMQLYSNSGVRIGALQGAPVEVHADWEGIGALLFGVIVVGFFGFGLFRSIRRRRREKAAAGEPAAAEQGAPRG